MEESDGERIVKHKVSITFSPYIDCGDLDGVEFDNYRIEAEQLPKDERPTGGLIWEGVVVFISGSIAAGFFGAIGQDAYSWLRDRLFKKKLQLKPRPVYRFTVNIKLDNGMAFFIFTDLDKGDFDEALAKARAAFLESRDFIEKEGGYFDFEYDKKEKKWLLARNKSFDI